jgi:pyridoxal phosphate enzyme (YggS family)
MENFNIVKNKVNKIIAEKQLKLDPNIIVVTKTFSLSQFLPILESGHIHYGENKIQEAEKKWSGVRTNFKQVKLHMIGPLQSNKAKKAVQIFDYIHSLDNEKLAAKIASSEGELSKKMKIFIQINIADENQKSGIKLSELDYFYKYCTQKLSLNIIGLMCLPPINSNPNKYFKALKENSEKLNLKNLSMGMSADYEQALINGSTHLRLGSVILGKRKII